MSAGDRAGLTHKWRIEMKWWGLVDGYPSVTWKIIEEHDSEQVARRSFNEWRELHGAKTEYRMTRLD